MAVSDTLIELLTFSKEELQGLAKDQNVTLPRGDKFDTAQAMSQQITLAELREVAGEHLGAGRTSLSWAVRLPPSSDTEAVEEPVAEDTPLTGNSLTIDEVRAALAQITGKRDPFNANVRPREVTTDPTLVNAQYDGDDIVLLTLAYQRTQRLVIRNFEYHRSPEDNFFHIVLRLSRGVAEIRAEARIATKVTKGWLHTLAEALGRQAVRLHLSQRDVDDLRETLNGRIDKHDARLEDEDAGYGRQVVTASHKYPDVTTAPRFKADFEGSDPVSSDLLFDYAQPDGNTKDVRIRISPRAGTIRCVNHVSNDVMEHVYDTLREIRAERAKASAIESSPKTS